MVPSSAYSRSLAGTLVLISRTTLPLKVALFATVWLSAAACLTVVTTPAGPPQDGWSAAYQGARFFMLDAPGMPTAGPDWAIYLYRLVVFLAPAISGGILLDVGSHLITRYAAQPAQLLGLRGHAVVIGYGAHGQAIARWFRRQGLQVAILDKKARGHGGWVELEGQWCPVIEGDLQDREALIAVGAHRAAVCAIATREQLHNLAAAEAICSLDTDNRSNLITLVDDADAMHPVADLLMRRSHDRSRIHLLDRFELAGLAARAALREHDFLRPCASAGLQGQAIVLVVGLGRFGRAIVRELARAPSPQKGVFLVVDPLARTRQRQLDRMLDGTGWAWDTPPDYAGEDALTWALGLREPWPGLRAVFLCIDDDVLNLQLGAALRTWLTSAQSAHEVPVNVILRIAKPIGTDRGPGPGLSLADGMIAYATQELVEEWLEGASPELRPPAARGPTPRSPATSPPDPGRSARSSA